MNIYLPQWNLLKLDLPKDHVENYTFFFFTYCFFGKGSMKVSMTFINTFEVFHWHWASLTRCKWGNKSLTLSWRRPISYRNQSIDFLRKSMDWFLYDIGLHHERVNSLEFRNKYAQRFYNPKKTFIYLSVWNAYFQSLKRKHIHQNLHSQ